MRQCGQCLEFFDTVKDVEIHWDGQPFHRDCLKEKVTEEVPAQNQEEFYEVIENPAVIALKDHGDVVEPIVHEKSEKKKWKPDSEGDRI